MTFPILLFGVDDTLKLAELRFEVRRLTAIFMTSIIFSAHAVHGLSKYCAVSNNRAMPIIFRLHCFDQIVLYQTYYAN